MTSKEALKEIGKYNCNGVLNVSDTQEYEIIEKDLELLEKYEKYISQLVEGHNKLQSAEDWGDIADSAFLIRTALEKMGVIEED